MAANNFTGKIEHNEDTIQRLYKARFHAYERFRMLIKLLAGFAFVMVAFFAGLPLWAKGVLLLIGAWLMVSLDFAAQMQADKVLETRKGLLPVMEYVFYPDRVAVSGEGSMTINYKKFKKIIQDESYFYLFITADRVCMVSRESIRPKKQEEFMEFIENKTALKWEREKSFFSLNYYDIKEILSERKKGKK